MLKPLLWVIGVIVLVSLLSFLTYPGEARKTVSAGRTLVQNAAQLIDVSAQDENPMFALVHATEALTYARALAMLGHEDNIRRLYALTPQELIERARDRQTKAMQAIAERYSDALPNGATSIAAGYAPVPSTQPEE